jgi:hypothetical protein
MRWWWWWAESTGRGFEKPWDAMGWLVIGKEGWCMGLGEHKEGIDV